MDQISEHVFLYPYEEERDRPTLGYIHGDRLNLAVEAGHSKAHLAEFYADLVKDGLPLPDLTIVTHWHWDHTFALPFIHGVSIAESRTNAHLHHLVEQYDSLFQKKMMEMDPHIALEYQNQSMQVVPADLTFHDQLELELGGCSIKACHVPSPHTDDSTVILIQEDCVLFVGDAPSGPYPNYDVYDAKAMQALKNAVEPLDFKISIGGHWPVEKREVFLSERLK